MKHGRLSHRSQRHTGKISKFALIALGGLAVLLGLFLAWRSTQTTVGGVAFSQLSPAEQAKRREELKKLETEIGGIGDKAKQHQKAPFSLTITEEHLNTLLQDRLRTEKAPIRDLRAGLSPGLITLQGTIDYKGISAPATMTGTLSVENGQVIFHAESLSAGGLPVGSFKDKIEKEVNKNLEKAIGELPVKLDSITLEDKQLTAKGVTD